MKIPSSSLSFHRMITRISGFWPNHLPQRNTTMDTKLRAEVALAAEVPEQSKGKGGGQTQPGEAAAGIQLWFWSCVWTSRNRSAGKLPVVFSGPTARKTSTSWASGLGIMLETLSEWNICASGTLKMKRCRVGCRRPRSCTSHFRLSTWHFTRTLPSTIYTWKFTDRFYTLRLKLHFLRFAFYIPQITFYVSPSTFFTFRTFDATPHTRPSALHALSFTLHAPPHFYASCCRRWKSMQFTRHIFYVHLYVHVHCTHRILYVEVRCTCLLYTCSRRCCRLRLWRVLKPQTHRWLLAFSWRIEAADTPLAAGIQLENWSRRHTVGCWHSAAELKPQTHGWLLAFSCWIEAADTPLAAGI